MIKCWYFGIHLVTNMYVGYDILIFTFFIFLSVIISSFFFFFANIFKDFNTFPNSHVSYFIFKLFSLRCLFFHFHFVRPKFSFLVYFLHVVKCWGGWISVTTDVSMACGKKCRVVTNFIGVLFISENFQVLAIAPL